MTDPKKAKILLLYGSFENYINEVFSNNEFDEVEEHQRMIKIAKRMVPSFLVHEGHVPSDLDGILQDPFKYDTWDDVLKDKKYTKDILREISKDLSERFFDGEFIDIIYRQFDIRLQ